VSALRGLRRRAVQVRGGRIPGSGGWQPYLLTLFVLVLVWMALWGSASLIVILIGLAVSALILLLFPLPTMVFRFGLHPWRTLLLVVVFLWDVVVASVQVGWLALRPRLPQPTVTTVQLASDSDLLEALTALAVSLVPGSLIVDADSQTRELTIHVLDAQGRSMDEFAAQVLAQEQRIRLALGDNDDPDPQPSRNASAPPKQRPAVPRLPRPAPTRPGQAGPHPPEPKPKPHPPTPGGARR
jgi:multicomponent Na+:H+ antiporter subunit E